MILDDMIKALGAMKREGKRASQWRISPEGWDAVRYHSDHSTLWVDPQDGKIKTVFGLPFSIACDLPAEPGFVLEDEQASRVRVRAEHERRMQREDNARTLERLAGEIGTVRDV